MKKVFHIPTLILLLFFVGFMHPVNAQKDLTIYPMQSIPQSNYNNPALIPDCKFYIGCFPIIPVPVLPSIYFSANNSGFNWSNAVHKARVDSNYVDLNDLIKHLGKKNYLSANLDMELLSFGFKIKRVHYITLGIYEKVNFRFCYPKDLISMIWSGNSQFIGGEASFNGIGLDWMHYRELALGYSYIYDANWTFGGRVKILFGMSNIWTKKSKATLGIDENNYDFTAKSGMHINTSIDDDLMNRIETAFKDTTGKGFDMSGYNPLDYVLNMKNMGGALDLGASYKINKQFSVAASLLDFGYIHFKTGARNFISPDTTFVFEGVDITDWIRKGDSNSTNGISKLVDSVSKIYQLNKTKKPYWAPLNPIIYLSGFYSPSKRDMISLLARLEIYKGTVHPAVTAGYYRTFKNDASFSINYSYFNRSWFNLGFGGSYKIGPMQFWVTTDNLFSGIMPYKIKNANVHVGCNLIFYYKNYYPLLKS